MYHVKTEEEEDQYSLPKCTVDYITHYSETYIPHEEFSLTGTFEGKKIVIKHGANKYKAGTSLG